MSEIEGSKVNGTRMNPLLSDWDTPFQLPPFETIEVSDFKDAFALVFDKHRLEIEQIIKTDAAPSFSNVVEALEDSGRDLQRVCRVFFNLSSADTNDALQAIERDIAPKLSAHFDGIYLNDVLFKKVDALWLNKDALTLSGEQSRLLERYHIAFVRSGARLDASGKARAAEINEKLATLCTEFSQNVLADEASFKLTLDGEEDLHGLPDFVRGAAKQAALDAGLEDKHLITLARSSVETFLQFSARRDLRERAFEAWIKRGEGGGETDNGRIISEIVLLRDELAQLLGFDNFAAFKLDDTMAKSTEAVNGLLSQVWGPARKQALAERDALQDLIQAEGGNFDLAAWDWRYYSEKLRKQEHDLNEEEIKPYLQLNNMIEAAFHTANKLFGLSFKERTDLNLYRDDVRGWEVIYPDDRENGLFLGDYFSRPSKRSGAWMSSFRSQEKFGGDKRPIVVNVLNFSKGTEGDPALLSVDDAVTLFHEFGHGLHGLLSDVTYPQLSGTSVSPDFVELPSQLFEHWFWQPGILKQFAVHYETGEPMPDDLIDRIGKARNFNQGFATLEYLACAQLDLDLHSGEVAGAFNPSEFEEKALEAVGMPNEIVMRHRLPHFMHIFAGSGYAAGYYSYLWSEVMDADAFAAFQETGDVFHPGLAKKLHDNIYSSGGRMEPGQAYIGFRGRLPDAGALLKKRGFSVA